MTELTELHQITYTCNIVIVTYANIQIEHLQHMSETDETYETFCCNICKHPDQNACNIRLEQMRHFEQTLATCLWNTCNTPDLLCNIPKKQLQHRNIHLQHRWGKAWASRFQPSGSEPTTCGGARAPPAPSTTTSQRHQHWPCLSLASGACYEREWAVGRTTEARSKVWMVRVMDGGQERGVRSERRRWSTWWRGSEKWASDTG
jgi:hypothetical protein